MVNEAKGSHTLFGLGRVKRNVSVVPHWTGRNRKEVQAGEDGVYETKTEEET